MAEQYHEAPPLPRVPTVIGSSPVPSSEQDTSQNPPAVPGNLPAPPKFPSLSDVNLVNAQQAAENVGFTQQSTIETTYSETSTIAGPATPVSQIVTEQDQDPLVMRDDISTAIQRDSVTPGSGVKKALEAGAGHWTFEDQKDLDKLLKEGKRVYVPPDVDAFDLPISRDTQFVPVPPTTGEASPTDSYDSRSLPQRIAMWNQVIAREGMEETNETKDVYFVSGVSDAEHTTREAGAMKEERNNTIASRDVTGKSSEAAAIANSSKKSQVPTSSKINGSAASAATSFLTVEVISKRNRNEHNISTTSDDPALVDKNTNKMISAITENAVIDEPLLVDSSANISVTDDYGLKGGHASRVHDAAFLDADTLVTCGADGKVIIWDMPSRCVAMEFIPYQGEPVTMIYPMIDDDSAIDTYTVMTLSESRLLRVWLIEDSHAVVLHSTQITPSDKELFMSVPVISPEIRTHAAAAIAAAKTASGNTESTTQVTQSTQFTSTPQDDPNLKTSSDTQPSAAVPSQETQDEPSSPKESDKKERRFSLTKVLSFGRRGNKEPVAS